MKRLLVALLLCPLLLVAQSPESLVHNPRTYVDDFADVYTDQQERQLDQLIRSFFDTVQISVVTIKTFGDLAPSEFALRLGRHWGVGGASSNGLIIVHSIDDRRIEVATGYGIEGDLPDALVTQLQRQYAVPKFKASDYYGGMYDLIGAYIEELSPAAKAIRAEEARKAAIKRQQAWENTKPILLWILAVITLGGAVFYWRWRVQARKEKLESERRHALMMKMEKQRDEEWRKQREEMNRRAEIRRQRELNELIESAQALLNKYPRSAELMKSAPPNRQELVAQFEQYRSQIREGIQSRSLKASLLTQLTLLYKLITMSDYDYKNYLKQQADEKEQQRLAQLQLKQRQAKEAEEAEQRRRKRRQQEDKEYEERRRRNLFSSDYSSPSSSDSTDSGSSSSFGGGSFGGGGGGSDY